MYVYQIQLGPSPEEGPNLVVITTTEMGGDYELNQAILDRMMATIEFFGSTQ
jgi:MoxR-like ATPase